MLRSALLIDAGFEHGFSLRDFGADLAEHRARFAEEMGDILPFELSQVHGRRVRHVARSEDPIVVRREEGDGLWTDEHGVAVAVRVADCIPLLIAHPPSGTVAAVHAGWRGVEARIAEAAIDAMALPASELLCVIGPHIRVEKFEVGEDVAVRLAAVAHGREVIDRSYEKPHVDLTTVLRAQLEALGVGSIDDVGGCTHSDPTRFFSYRRDGSSGRHMAGIVSPRR